MFSCRLGFSTGPWLLLNLQPTTQATVWSLVMNSPTESVSVDIRLQIKVNIKQFHCTRTWTWSFNQTTHQTSQASSLYWANRTKPCRSEWRYNLIQSITEVQILNNFPKQNKFKMAANWIRNRHWSQLDKTNVKSSLKQTAVYSFRFLHFSIIFLWPPLQQGARPGWARGPWRRAAEASGTKRPRLPLQRPLQK